MRNKNPPESAVTAGTEMQQTLGENIVQHTNCNNTVNITREKGKIIFDWDLGFLPSYVNPEQKKYQGVLLEKRTFCTGL